MFRRYLVAFVAVCLAFAAGIALGNGPLQGNEPVSVETTPAQANAALQDKLAALRRDQAFSQAVSGAAGAALLRGRLQHASVALFVLPGVSPQTVAGVVRDVEVAGGDVTIKAHLRPALVDASRKTYVDSVATATLKGMKDLASSAKLPTYERIGAELARAYTGGADNLVVDDEATKLDAQLQGSKLVSLHDRLQRRANAVIVLADDEHGSSDAVAAEHQIELQIVDALAGDADALVLAAPIQASLPGGLLDALAASSPRNAISTVNVVDTPAGQAVTVAALAAGLAGHPGEFGMDGAAVSLPSGLTSGG